nr:hypothetical protein [Pseudomonas sp. FW300-N2F2]
MQALQNEFDWIGDVRGRGLMLGMEIVDPQGTPDVQGHPPLIIGQGPASGLDAGLDPTGTQ